ncbi:helix-turn-helix domain-containing protein [Nocardia goodfellowii]|uniref:DNA-binding NarL/FixJ family response regulator n=1 Tax=Nocardia goodfellowii TaxID=882446 RepID=A0ABS4QIP0_9NOCA|nr:response regulator transcription factor [Nocardia goodfellowii]MBP2191582.1 DNA-binding NarL/FixJ family response regulator [Nocardia goodfellowii]
MRAEPSEPSTSFDPRGAFGGGESAAEQIDRAMKMMLAICHQQLLAMDLLVQARNSICPDTAAEVGVDGDNFEPAHRLTPREKQILRLIGEGRSNRRIARQLGIAEKTVRNHVHFIFRKIDVSSRAEAAVLALQGGWLLDETAGPGDVPANE